MQPPDQVLSALFDNLSTLLVAEVSPANRDRHNEEVTRVREQITQAKAELAAENTRRAEERAALEAESQRIQSESYRLMLDQNASNEVMRRHRTRLPAVYEGVNLFNTPGAGTSNPPAVNRAEAPGTGAPVQPRAADATRLNNVPPQHMQIPLGHYSNPVDNMIAAATRLAAIPIEGESPAAVETRRARDLLQMAVTQQQAYSRSHERIHSTPRVS